MTELRDKVQNALEEARILVLGAQVFLGLQYRSAFETGFTRLSTTAQYLKLGALVLILVAIVLLMSPGAYHRIVEDGEDTQQFHRFTTQVMDWALLPFALTLGIEFYIATGRLASRGLSITAGLAATLVALFFWYGLEVLRRRKRKLEIEERERMKRGQKSADGGTEIKDKVKHVLTEARMVLPGAQALLGFQFITMLMEGFEQLPVSSKYVHLASLMAVALTTIFLMTPAAYHRIVERGAETEHFHRFSSRMILMAMVTLALGISGDFFVVARKVTDSVAFAVIGATLTLSFCYGLWFGFTSHRRSARAEKRNVSADEL